MRFKSKVDAFKIAQNFEPAAEREKLSGFVLIVGAQPQVLEVGSDRDQAIQSAIEILENKDTVVFLSKLQAAIGQLLITKDQLIFSRKMIGGK